MKILYPMQVGGGDAPKEVASLEEFIGMLNGEPGGTFLLGGNRIWHGGIHLSDKGGWHSGGAVRAIADGEIVAYRIASDPVSVTLEPEEGKPGEPITLHTSPSFCLIRHRYEATEEVSGQQQPKRNTLTFYCLYMHIACKNAYQGEPERHVLTGSGVAIYKATASLQFQKEDKLGTAHKGAEVTLIGAPSERRNLRNEPHSYQLVSYAAPKGGDPSEFYLASQFIKEERKVEPDWMMAKQDIPSLYPISRNSYLRKSKDQGEAVAAGLPKTSKVARTTAQPVVFSNMKEYLEVEVWNISQGKLTDDKGNVVPNASKGDRYWIAKEMLGQPSDAVRHTPIVYDKVELRHTNPIPVKVGEVVGHWGEHETPKPTASGFVLNEDRKAIHMEIFVAESDKEALGKCISNEGKLAKGQEYLLLKEGELVDTYKLTKENNKVGYSKVGAFGPLEAPKPINTQDIVTHGADKFVKVAEDQHVLISGATRLVNQHEWARLGVTLVDGGSDPDGFLDKADTDGKEGGDFFSTLYEELVTDRDGDGSISADEIKAAMAEKMVADKVRKLFIKHESEWVKRDTWPRLKQELKNMPNLYQYVLEMTNEMAWIEQAAEVVGDTKPWFIHPAGMIGLVADPVSDDEMDKKWLTVPKGQLTFDAEGNDVDTSMYFSRHPHVPNNRGVVIGASGVTYGRGLDLGQISIGELNKLTTAISDNCKPLSSSMLQWLTGAVGLQRQAAYDYAIAINNLVPRNEQTLTRKQQHYLFNEIYLKLEAIAKRTVENPKGTRTRAAPNGIDLDPERIISWTALPQNIKDLLIDLTFRGDNRPSTREFFIPDLIESIKNNDEFSALKENIKSNRWKETYKVPLDRHQRRCNYL
ncbi:pesticin C-terminus-like muramidase [Aeromonas caviae]|uniref:pesticin C-terminus-like muramidase n=1 Tax=Aeromonas caviae TaxID=648 RepID=UPI002B469B62|nr:pesticin C-terminus-like muramidase [Aeromonas caviae]